MREGALGPTPGLWVGRLAGRWRVVVDRTVAPPSLTHAQYSVVASLHGMRRADERHSQRRCWSRSATRRSAGARVHGEPTTLPETLLAPSVPNDENN
ncbi:hypothetical protein ACFWDQ_33000 [Streptomyces sp. NPDC060053]|uniref:hypothetical protein n=1 Tax=Streptomyces sp. NPDC060053 TaxID=3347047 RepID=UPI00367AA714